ncbi:CbtB domain-containing protein [Micromonospora aurantiaca (nom. illeg.)]|uniref:CbtB domain-containing protein n=1 Tax=Micromonospora aurantiaca (nom. illeg.) TaxID=47850 RepID=UPI003F4A4221
MSNSVPARPTVHAPVSARMWWTALAVTAALLLLAYLVAFDQGAVSRSGMYLHELMHDGRHLLGVPCH